MSLSRILNDSGQKSPSPSAPAYVHDMAIDPALMEIPMRPNSPPPPTASSHHQQHPQHQQQPQEAHPSPGQYYYPPQAYPHHTWGSPPWDNYASGVWVPPPDHHGRPPSQELPYFQGRDGVYYPMYPQHPQLQSHPHQQLPQPASPTDGRKRKRAEQPVEKRSQPTRTAKQGRRYVTRDSSTPPASEENQDRRYEARIRLASSDLDDSEEIWTEELGRYILENRLRARDVEAWFENKSAERNQDVARWAAHSYQARLAAISHLESNREVDQDLLSAHEHSNPNGGRYSPFDEDDEDKERQLDDPPNYRGSHDSVDDVTRELEDAVADSSSRKGKGKKAASSVTAGPSSSSAPKRKRGSKTTKSEDESDILDLVDGTGGSSKRRTAKRKKFATDEGLNLAEELERFADDITQPDDSVDGQSQSESKRPSGADYDGDFKVKAKKRPPRKKKPGAGDSSLTTIETTEQAGQNASPESPMLAGFYNIGEPIPDMKKGKKVDQLVLARRLVALEEAQRKVWLNIARRDIPKVYRFHSTGFAHKVAHHKKLSSMVMTQAKRVTTRTSKAAKDTQAKARRVTREMLIYWKRNDREEGVSRKKAEKEAMDKAKAEEEKREAARQARKLEFLITQTELYSHFVGNKLKTSDLEQDPDAGPYAGPSAEPGPKPVVDISATDVNEPLEALDFDRDDRDNLTRHAARKAQEQVTKARERAQAFDAVAARDRQKNEALTKEKPSLSSLVESEPPTSNMPLLDLDSDELNFQNPTSMTDQAHITQPKMLSVKLKDYQLKGLNWLATLYEQGINGILADEMGLGKTVQSISLLAYLIETHDIWGPFLVIAPSSTLFNWQQELGRFVPKVKALPYWGNPKDRALLRKFWSKKEISYNEDAPFNVLITSYQMVVQDAQYFQKVNWQYMILDEAQAIKSSASARWKTLLGFSCRNRLLLTGTPIQNSMQELWALLHFIMPSLFDSHDEFSEWFSKDIEHHAENKGESNLNEHQLRRLHMILKPFMLRRVKKNVQNELGDKIEIDLFCDLSPRQRALYRGLRANVSVADLLAKASRLGDADSARSLMNLVMQFRKVCNHPDLFERADVTAPFAFCDFAQSGNLSREKDFLFYPDTAKNPISLPLPRLFYEDGALPGIPGAHAFGDDTRRLSSMMNIWRIDSVALSLKNSGSPFSFLPLLDISPGEANHLIRASLVRRLLIVAYENSRYRDEYPFLGDGDFAAHSILPFARIRPSRVSPLFDVASGLSPLSEIGANCWQASCLTRPQIRTHHTAAVVAPPIQINISHRSFVEAQNRWFTGSHEENVALYGLPPTLKDSQPAFEFVTDTLPGLNPHGLVTSSSRDQLPKSPIVVPEPMSLISDSAKLARLDALLDELKPGGHRVLIYFQMTRMIDLMEEYMTFRKHKYLRLDGSSKLEDRRDMVSDWQARPDIFVFLLSTRAGGLGINLTAADTVIFYDHDWNPSNDSQAMDRAHRLGQTRQVTVYRLITKGTIDERIVQLARVKKDVQDIVVGSKQFSEGAKTSDIASLLLNDDELAMVNSSRNPGVSTPTNGDQQRQTESTIRDMWHDEGDDFFGHETSIQAAIDAEVNDEIRSTTSIPTTAVAPKRKGKGRAHKKKPGPATGDTLPEDL